jgi:hypothetical protein
MCDRSTSKARSEEGNAIISHLHKQTKGGKYIYKSMNRTKSQEGNVMVSHLDKQTKWEEIHATN